MAKKQRGLAGLFPSVPLAAFPRFLPDHLCVFAMMSEGRCGLVGAVAKPVFKSVRDSERQKWVGRGLGVLVVRVVTVIGF